MLALLAFDTPTSSALKAELYKLASIPVAGAIGGAVAIGRPASQPGSKSQVASPHKLPAGSPANSSAAAHVGSASLAAPAAAQDSASASSSIKAKPKKRKSEALVPQASATPSTAATDACPATALSCAAAAVQPAAAASKPPQARAPKKPKAEGSDPASKKAPKIEISAFKAEASSPSLLSSDQRDQQALSGDVAPSCPLSHALPQAGYGVAAVASPAGFQQLPVPTLKLEAVPMS